MITNYFIPHSKSQDNRYLNITLSLIDNITIRQQQSILIHDQRKDYLNAQLNNSSLMIVRYILLLFVLLISFDR